MLIPAGTLSSIATIYDDANLYHFKCMVFISITHPEALCVLTTVPISFTFCNYNNASKAFFFPSKQVSLWVQVGFMEVLKDTGVIRELYNNVLLGKLS